MFSYDFCFITGPGSLVMINDKKQEHQTDVIVGILSDESVLNNHENVIRLSSTEKV